VAKNNKLGYGKNAKDSEKSEMGNPQPSPKAPSAMDAVQRLNVGGPCLRVGHKIESGPTENVASRRNLQQLYPAEEESLEEYHIHDTGWPAGLFQLIWLSYIFYILYKSNTTC
jgi:hypothetical protein